MPLEDQITGEMTIEKLPENVLLEIMRYLSMRDRCRGRRVCKTWNRILCDSSLWRHIDLRNYRTGLLEMWRIVTFCMSPSLLTLKIRGYAYSEMNRAGDICSSEPQGLGTLNEVKKKRDLLFGTVDSLRRKISLSDDLMQDLSARCPKLQLLHLHECRLEYISFESLPRSIRCLEVVNACWVSRWMKGKKKHMRKLEKLVLDNSGMVGDGDLEDVAVWKNLKYLSIKGCSRVTKAGIMTIAKHLLNLEFLNLSCIHIDDLALHQITQKFKKLKELNLAESKSVNDNDVASIAVGLPVLNKLDISYCDRVTVRGLHSLFVSSLSVLIVKRLPRLSEQDLKTLKCGFSKNVALVA